MDSTTQTCSNRSTENQVTEKLQLNYVPLAPETLITKKPYLLKSLPPKYGLLVKFFNRLDFSIKLLKARNCIPTFTNIKNLIDKLTTRTFTYTHLAELKYIFPDGIKIDKVLVCDNKQTKHDLHVTLKSPDNNSLLIRNLFRKRLLRFCKSHPKGVDIPCPIVVIDQDDETVVKVSFGGPLDHLIDMMKEVKDLGLDVSKRSITTEGSVIKTEFIVTQLSSGRKVEDPDLVENIRLTIVNNLVKYHPSSTRLGIQAPLNKLDVDIATHLLVKDDGPKRSLLCIETEDRPGLLLQIFKIMAEDNITVESAEINTDGFVAKNKFYVSYNGSALNDSLTQVLKTCLRYYLDKSEIGGRNSSSTQSSIYNSQ